MPGGRITTATGTRFDNPGRTLTGNEVYPVIGSVQPNIQLAPFKGLHRQYDCEKKAQIARDAFDLGALPITLGSMYATSADGKSEYGFEYRPPFEFHAWLQLPDRFIIDMALPGVIESGMAARDHIGPCPTGRKPAVLIGRPPSWLRYVPIIKFAV